MAPATKGDTEMKRSVFVLAAASAMWWAQFSLLKIRRQARLPRPPGGRQGDHPSDGILRDERWTWWMVAIWRVAGGRRPLSEASPCVRSGRARDRVWRADAQHAGSKCRQRTRSHRPGDQWANARGQVVGAISRTCTANP